MTDPRVDDIVDAALDRDPEAWPAFLDEVCGRDRAVRDDVESLLAVHVAHPDLLQPGPPAALAVPERIGRYRIRREIARGGMGVVYEAEDEVLGRAIALKVLPAHLAGDPVWLRRFEREARHLAALEHPNIANVHTLEEADGVRFLTMELVADPSLRERLADGALPLPRALAILARIARAVETLHRKGITHCDLKPENVLVSEDDHVTVIDFGLARRRDAATDAPLTRTGTPGYMAPEQIEGGGVDAHTDLWAFGCLAFECTAGVPAFPGDPMERRRATLCNDPDWTQLPADLPSDVRDAIVRCLAREPGERPERIATVRRGLEEAVRIGTAYPEDARPGAGDSLPVWRNEFVGRTVEADALARQLGRARLVTITGTGGAGKTRLASHVGRRRLDAHADGVRFADLSAATGELHALETVATACDVRSEPGTDPLDAIAATLREKQVLLILDNCEHRLEACRVLARRLLETCPGVVMLATSREPLGVEGETNHALAPLPRPDAHVRWAPDELAEVESVALFLARTAETDPAFRLTEENADAVAELCRRLDGIPLAIELAATRPEEAAAAAPHRTLDDVIAWSYRLLAPEEQALFRALVVFAGGFPWEAVAAVGPPAPRDGVDLAPTLHALLRKSLVTIDDRARPVTGDVRFRLLEPIRAFALAVLPEGERIELRKRHAAYFVAFAERGAPRLKGPDAVAALAAFAAEHDNLRAALDHALGDDGDALLALRLAAALETYWTMRGHWKEAAHATNAALHRPGAEAPTAARGHVLNAAALFALHAGEPERADRLYDEALDIGRTIGDEDVLARSIHNKGGVALGQGRLADARACFEEYLAIQRRRGLRDTEVLALSNLGVTAEREGRLADAEALYGEALPIAEETGNRRMIGVLLNNLGAAALVGGRHAVARERLERALEIHGDAEDRWALALTRNLLGAVADAEDDATAARGHFHESLRLMDEVGSQEGIADLLTQLGVFAARRGAAARGAELLGAADALRQRIGTPLAANHADEVNAAIDAARGALGRRKYAACRKRGVALDTAAAVARALTDDTHGASA